MSQDPEGMVALAEIARVPPTGDRCKTEKDLLTCMYANIKGLLLKCWL